MTTSATNIDDRGPDRTRGLYGKYKQIERVDGKPVGQTYILEYEKDPHARAALAAYADSCERDNYGPLAKDIRARLTATNDSPAAVKLAALRAPDFIESAQDGNCAIWSSPAEENMSGHDVTAIITPSGRPQIIVTVSETDRLTPAAARQLVADLQAAIAATEAGPLNRHTYRAQATDSRDGTVLAVLSETTDVQKTDRFEFGHRSHGRKVAIQTRTWHTLATASSWRPPFHS